MQSPDPSGGDSCCCANVAALLNAIDGALGNVPVLAKCPCIIYNIQQDNISTVQGGLQYGVVRSVISISSNAVS